MLRRAVGCTLSGAGEWVRVGLDELDPNLVAPKRLAAMGILSAAKKVEFGYLRDQLELSASDLSKQLKVLSEAGYVTSRRTGKGATRASWFAITPTGSKALRAHADALQGLLQPPPPVVTEDVAHSLGE